MSAAADLRRPTGAGRPPQRGHGRLQRGETVAEVIDQVLKVDLDGRQLELVIVESNSTDGTREIVRSYEDHPERPGDLPGPALGKGFAVRAGLAAAAGDVDLIQDGDLEYSVDDYPALLEPIERGETAFVLGSRHVRGKPMRHFAESRCTSVVLNTAHWVLHRDVRPHLRGAAARPVHHVQGVPPRVHRRADVLQQPLRLRLGARRPS